MKEMVQIHQLKLTFHSKHFLARGQPNKTRQYNDDNNGDEVVAMVTRVENGFEWRER